MSILGWCLVVTRIGNRPRPNGRWRKRKKGGRVIDFLAISISISASALQSLIFLSFFLYPHVFHFDHEKVCSFSFSFSPYTFRFLLTRTLHYKHLHMHLYYSNSILFFCVHNFVDDDLDFSGLFGLILLLLVFGVVKHIYLEISLLPYLAPVM
jgi:hypothetical protein